VPERNHTAPALRAPQARPGWRYESELWAEGYRVVAGVDEAGRGAWAGPVVVAIALLPVSDHPFDDSKRVTPRRREQLADLVRLRALAWAIVEADAAEVDRRGVLNATLAAAERGVRALVGLPVPVAEVMRRVEVPLDGLVTDYLALPVQGWSAWRGPRGLRHPPRADASSQQVAAASLLAKVHRDHLMRRAAVRWPVYGFERHKGYGAAAHRRALERYGPCPLHRKTFRPVAALATSDAPQQEEPACPTPSV